MAIVGYRSPVDIGLGRTPQTVDPDLFDELNDVYNAIHLLNQYLDNVSTGGGGTSNPTDTPAQAMPFTRYFTNIALASIKEGDVVSPSNITGENGIILGGLAHDYMSTAPESNFSQIALIDAEIGEPVQVGVGPAILQVSGAISGQLAYCFPARDTAGNKVNNGNIYMGNPGTITVTPAPPGGTAITVTAMPIGTCVVNDYVLFGQFIKR